MYKPLLVNVSVSLIVSGVQPHMTMDTVEFPYASIQSVEGWSSDLSPIVLSKVDELSRFTSAPVLAFSRTV